MAIFLPGDDAAAIGDIAAMVEEARSRYGFNATFSMEEMLEETLFSLSVYPGGMIKEMADGFRSRGITPSIRDGDFEDAKSSDFGIVAGYASLSSNRVTITLYSTYAVGHEIGHAIDFYLGKLAGRSTVSHALVNFNGGAKYGAGYIADVFSTWYGSSSNMEDFAEIADQLFFFPEKVRDYIRTNPDTPLTKKYHYVMDIIVGGFGTLQSKELTFPAIFAIDVVLDGDPLSFDVPALIIGGRTMAPLRAIFEAMGASVNWDGATQTATATRGDTVVVITIGSTSPTVNGQVVSIDQPGAIYSGRTLAPMRFVAEAFGGTVNWDAAARTAYIAGGAG